MRREKAWGLWALIFAASVATAGEASARVRHEGKWPEPDKLVTLDLDGVPRAQALRKLADAAGWSLVVHAPPGTGVDVHVKNQPAGKVLDLLLDDGDYVATRDGSLVSIEAAAASAPSSSPSASVSAAPPVPPAPAEVREAGADAEARARGKDRTVFGGEVHILKGETARDVTVFGGDIDIEGEVTGDVTVFGGEVRVRGGARVHGDASVFGGELTLDDGARIDGDVNAVGGEVKRGSQAIVGGGSPESEADDAPPPAAHVEPPPKKQGIVATALESLAHGVRLGAMLFVIGTMLIALAGRRMEMMRAELAARPMKSVALGLVGILGAAIVVVALCVTIIGIPIAVVGVIVGTFAVLGGMCAVLSVAGEALLRHKTENPYAHLAVGCALFVVLVWVPWVGTLAGLVTAVAGIGVLVSTRVAGFFAKKNGSGQPYRSEST
jgi:hypothetical protein